MRRFLVAVALLLLSGCGANQFSLPSFGSSSNMTNAKASIAAKDWYPAFFALTNDLESQEQPRVRFGTIASVEDETRRSRVFAQDLVRARVRLNCLRQDALDRRR